MTKNCLYCGYSDYTLVTVMSTSLLWEESQRPSLTCIKCEAGTLNPDRLVFIDAHCIPEDLNKKIDETSRNILADKFEYFVLKEHEKKMFSACNTFSFSKREENTPSDEWSDDEIGNVSDDEKESKKSRGNREKTHVWSY